MTKRPGPPPRPLAERFHEKYEIDPDSGCWNWTGAITGHGYGSINSGAPERRTMNAYKLSYEMHHGPVPAGLVVDHICNNKRCVNPGHLQAITYRANLLRSPSPNVKRFHDGKCIRGHDITDPANAYIRKDTGQTMCRECGRIRQSERARRNGVPPQRPPSPCGTNSACIEHYKRGEKPCEPCMEARRQFRRERRQAGKAA